MKHLVTMLGFFIGICTSVFSQNLADSLQLIQIKTTIKSQYTSWVIFSNGTYLVITADSSTPNLRNKAIEILKYNGTHEGKKLNKSNFVLEIKDINGWIVDSPFEGLYTYVSSKELSDNGIVKPTDSDIILFGMAKRQKDIIEYKIVEASQ